MVHTESVQDKIILSYLKEDFKKTFKKDYQNNQNKKIIHWKEIAEYNKNWTIVNTL